VLIVGGGLAGLAAAAALAGRGLRITLLESRPRLGGRASSFQDPATGELVDNCQHVSMACCTNLADFCRRVGAGSLFRRESAVEFLGPDGRLSRLAAGIWPAPFHLAGSFLRARYLSLGDKLRVAYGLAGLRMAGNRQRGECAGGSFADWLLRHGQTVRTINLYWATVLVSALNERLERMDIGHARKVFLDGFLRHRDAFRIEVPLVPLGELYGTRLEAWLAAQDVEVRLTTGVRGVEDDARGVVLRSGERIAADLLVLAVPFDRVRGLLPQALAARIPGLAGLDAMRAAPITGVHLWFDRPVCPLPHVVTVGRLIQWVFNHTAIQGRGVAAAAAGAEGASSGQYLQLVISAAYDLLAFDKAAILDLVLADLGEIWPEARAARLLRWWVVTEHGATFAVRPGIEALRPPQRTPVAGLYLAGDWTATGWPATMEGAVRSGYRAAEAILQDLGRPEALVRPGLAPGPLARWLLGPGEMSGA
jgi:squalene-associated FAD-dependent desaturase